MQNILKMDWIITLGLMAATFTTVSFLPQAIKTIKTKHVKGLSLMTYLIFNVGLIFWLIYGLMINNLPIILANIVTLIFTLTILGVIIKHR